MKSNQRFPTHLLILFLLFSLVFCVQADEKKQLAQEVLTVSGFEEDFSKIPSKILEQMKSRQCRLGYADRAKLREVNRIIAEAFAINEISDYISRRLSKALTIEELQYCLEMYNSSKARKMRREVREGSRLITSKEFLAVLPKIRKAYKSPERLALLARLDRASLLQETAVNMMVLTQVSYVLSVKGSLSWTTISIPKILEKAEENEEEFQETLDQFWEEIVWHMFQNIGNEDLTFWVKAEESVPMQKANRVFTDALHEACLDCLRKAGRKIVESQDLPSPPSRQSYPQR